MIFYLLHRRSFGTYHPGSAASQLVAGPMRPPEVPNFMDCGVTITQISVCTSKQPRPDAAMLLTSDVDWKVPNHVMAGGNITTAARVTCDGAFHRSCDASKSIL